MIFEMYKIFYSCLETLLLHSTTLAAFSKSKPCFVHGSSIFSENER
jgi:hypothetical protein